GISPRQESSYCTRRTARSRARSWRGFARVFGATARTTSGTWTPYRLPDRPSFRTHSSAIRSAARSVPVFWALRGPSRRLQLELKQIEGDQMDFCSRDRFVERLRRKERGTEGDFFLRRSRELIEAMRRREERARELEARRSAHMRCPECGVRLETVDRRGVE